MSEQRKAVFSEVPHVECLIGGPACGKTTKLLDRAFLRAQVGDDVLVVCSSKASAERARSLAQLRQSANLEIKTGVELACDVLRDESLAERGMRSRLLSRAEERVLMEDVKTCGIKRRRLRELVAFLECGWSNLDDEDPEWMKTNEEELVSDLLRGNLEFTGGVLACEASALAYRALRNDAKLAEKYACSCVFADDFEQMGKATQALVCLLARDSLLIASGDTPCVAVDEPYPYFQGVGELLSANPEVRVEHLTLCYRPAEIVDVLNALRADASLEVPKLDACGEPERPESSSADESGNRDEEGAEPVRPTVCVRMAEGIVPEFADIVSEVREAIASGVSASRIYVAGTNSVWRANLQRYLRQSGIPVCDAKRVGANSGQAPSMRMLVGQGDPLCRSVQIARLRAIAQPQGMRLEEALDALAKGNLVGASKDDRLLDGLTEAYWAARGKQADMDASPHFEAPDCFEGVRVGTPLEVLGREFDLVIFGGFVNGFIPSAEYFDSSAMVGATKERAHAADVQALYRVVASARERIAFTGFSECGLESAEQLKLRIARIRLKRGVRMCSIEPSELLKYVDRQFAQ